MILDRRVEEGGGPLGPGNSDEVDACGEGGENEVKCFKKRKRVYS